MHNQSLEQDKNESVYSQGANLPVTENKEEPEELEPYILTELEDERDAYTKKFLLSNGNCMAVQYEYPVHFIDDKEGTENIEESNLESSIENDTEISTDPDTGESLEEKKEIWVEYDNTMEETTDVIEETEPETITEPEIEKITEQLEITQPEVTTEIITEEATNYEIYEEILAEEILTEESTQNEETQTQTEVVETQPPVTEPSTTVEPTTEAIEETTETTEEFYKNKKSNIDIKLSKKSQKNNMVKIKDDNYQISWGYEKIKKSNINFIEDDTKLEGDEAFLTLKNVAQEAIYYDVF